MLGIFNNWLCKLPQKGIFYVSVNLWLAGLFFLYSKFQVVLLWTAFWTGPNDVNPHPLPKALSNTVVNYFFKVKFLFRNSNVNNNVEVIYIL